MRNYGRVLRLALRHRLTFAASVACALVVAIFWLVNISVIFPCVELTLTATTPPEWLDERIENGDFLTRHFARKLERL